MQSGGSTGATIPRPAGPAEATGGTAPRHPSGFAYGLLVLLALLLPFEAPLFHLGPLQITTDELSLYALLAAWGVLGAARLVRDPTMLRRVVADCLADGLARAAALWVIVSLASAAAAPSYRAAAFKFALRSTSGVLAFFATRSLARTALATRRVLLALVAGALLSAATALVDSFVPGSVPVWRYFREGSFDTFGLDRASGVFGYPTIGAMYWEAVVPLLVVAPFCGRRRGPDRSGSKGAAWAIGGGAVLVGAILASATRSGLAGVAVACGVFLWFGRRLGTSLRRAVLGVLVVLAALSSFTFAGCGSGSLLGRRLRWWDDGQWFHAEYVSVGVAPGSVRLGETFRVPVALRNTGAVTWRTGGPRPFHVAYHWEPLDRPATLADFEGLRTDLPADVPPGRETRVDATVEAPRAAGAYRLRWDVVEEEVTWFSERGNPMPDQSISVEGVADPAPAQATRPAAAPPPPSRPRLWRAAIALWRERPLLGIGPDNFRRRYGAVLSPSPDGPPYSDVRLHANSLYFETLADLGLAGVAVLAVMALALVRAMREHFSAGRLAGAGCAVGAALFFVHGVLDYFFEFTPLFGLFWVLLGLTAVERRAPSSAGLRSSRG